MRLSRGTYRHRFLLLALLLAGTALLFESPRVKHLHTRLLLEHFQHRMIARERFMQEMMSALERKAAAARESYLEILDDREEERLARRQVALFLYVNDSLVFWSDHTVDIDPVHDTVTGAPHLRYAGNGWYVIRAERRDTLVTVGYQLVRREYRYRNKYLRPRFFRGAGLGERYRLSTVPVENGFPVMSEEGEFLFSLVPVGGSDPLALRLIAAFLFLAAYLSFFLWLVTFARSPAGRRHRVPFLLGVLLLLGGIYLVMVRLEVPSSLFSLPLFSPYSFALSDWIPSLGVLFVVSMFFFSFSYLYWLLVRSGRPGTLCRKVRTFAGAFVTSFLFLLIIEVMYYLIMNSSLSFEPFRVLSISVLSVIGFLAVGFLVMSFLLLADRVLQVAGRFTWRSVVAITAAALLAFVVARYLLGFHLRWLELLVLGLFFLALMSRRKSVYAGLILTAVLAGLFSTLFILRQSFEKEKESMKVLAVGLGAEHDPVAELMLDEISDRISHDPELSSLMKKHLFTSRDVDNVHSYLLMKYFKGFWNKYDLSVYLCNPNDMIVVNDEKEESCSGFFHTLMREIGTPLRNSRFYYLDYQNGQITYFGAFHYPSKVAGDTNGLYIQLDSRLLYEQLGYPELLLDEATSREVMPSPYAYAKYYDGMLVAQNGSYAYPLTDEHFLRQTGGEEFAFLRMNGYFHLVYHENSPVTVVLSTPLRGFKDYLVSFSYFFIFFFLLFLLVFNRSLFRVKIYLRPVMLKQKIMLWMVSLLLFTLLLIGTFSILYNIRQFRANHYKNLSEKILSVYAELEHKLSFEQRLDRSWSSPGYPSLNDLMVKFSNVFYSDINLYDPHGMLLATSRPEIFEEKLAGNRMNEKAFYHMSVLKESEFIHKEWLGDLSYLSAYMPFLNNDGKLLAYLNLPYFTKQYVLTREISNMIVGIVNYMVVLILLTIVLAVVISDKITTPLRAIQERIGRFRLGQEYEHIVYDRGDEIGSLVDAYNRMIDELARNVELLARSERESAWREMAKQVAHEIKNPLTPMKLSVQQLQRAHRERKENFDEMFERLTATLIEQIDRLSYIASAFSNFARMPRMRSTPVDLRKVLQDVVYLFRADHQGTIELQLPERQVWVLADKELLESVFSNLVKNALQALDGRPDGRVRIFFRFDEEQRKVQVHVQDNGTGIPPDIAGKLFEPNFTTKSSGMGMGLAIVKKIVEDAGGRVWFETRPGGGTTFIVEMNLHEPAER